MWTATAGTGGLGDPRLEDPLLRVCLRFTAEDLRTPYQLARRVMAELARLNAAA